MSGSLRLASSKPNRFDTRNSGEWLRLIPLLPYPYTVGSKHSQTGSTRKLETLHPGLDGLEISSDGVGVRRRKQRLGPVALNQECSISDDVNHGLDTQ